MARESLAYRASVRVRRLARGGQVRTLCQCDEPIPLRVYPHGSADPSGTVTVVCQRCHYIVPPDDPAWDGIDLDMKESE